MKNRICVAAISSLSMLAYAPARADIIELTVIARADQASQIPRGLIGEVSLGVTTVARTSFWPLWHTLSAGAGLTMQCTSSAFAIKAERAFQTSDLGSLTLVVTAPVTVPGRYSIPGWNSIPEDTCVDCNMLYTGQAVEASAGISVSGAGASFTLSVAGAYSATDTMNFFVCKPFPCIEELP